MRAIGVSLLIISEAHWWGSDFTYAPAML